MNSKKEQRLDKILYGRDFPAFYLNLFLIMVMVEAAAMVPYFLMTGKTGYPEGAMMVIVFLASGVLLLFNIKYQRYRLLFLLAVFLLDGIAAPVMVLWGNVGYCITIMWFVASSVMLYILFERMVFAALMIFLIFDYSYVYSNVLFQSGGMVRLLENPLHFYELVVGFVGTMLFVMMLVHMQGDFCLYQKRKIAESSSKIEYARNAKRKFLTSMSYEIRSPMNSIINLSEIMLKEELDGETRSEVGTIRSSSYDLLSVIDDILTYAKIEAGDMHLIEEPYSFENLCGEIRRTISGELQKKKLDLDARIDHNIPKTLLGDSVAVRQIFLYLLFISIDNTESGRITVEIGCKRDEEAKKAYFQCRVADTGRGLSQIDVQSLFGMYDTYDSRQSSNLKGIGLKFSICKELLDLMQGSISVESIEGVGLSTTFSFYNEIVDNAPMIALGREIKPRVLIYADTNLDVSKWQAIMEGFGIRPTYVSNYYGFGCAIVDKRYDFIFVPHEFYESLSNVISLYRCEEYTYILADYNAVYGDYGRCRLIYKPISAIGVSSVLNYQWNREDYKRSSRSEPFTAKKAKVLVVDDNAVNLKVAAGIFSKYGIDIAVATCGEDSIRKIESEVYDLILMDMVMPDMSGSDVLRLIREKEAEYYKEVPIVALTAQNGANVREEMIELGFQEYLAKPVKRRYLEKCLLEFLPEELIERVAPEERTPVANNPIEEFEGVQKESLLELDTEKGLVNVGSSKEAYASVLNSYYTEGMKYADTLPALLEEGNISLFTTIVHGLKSSSMSVGAIEMSEIFREMEDYGKDNAAEEIAQRIDICIDSFQHVLELVREYLVENEKFEAK